MNIIEAFKNTPGAILACDEAHSLINLGDQEGANAAGNIFKPYLSRGEIQMILATTDDEFNKFMLQQKAFVRRFHKIVVEEPTKEETKEILKGLIPVENEFFGKEIKEELIDKIVKLADSYTLDQANPAKALALLDYAFAYSKVFKEQNKEVSIDDIIDSIRLRYGIFIADDKYTATKEELNSKILGQEEPLKKVCKALKMVDQGLSEPKKPKFVGLLAGPSGVGKTYTAELIAEKFCGSAEKHLIRIDMGEYGADMDKSKLTGASSGYVGYDDEPYLIKQIRQYPDSVVLFDEIEKASKDVLKVLLGIFDFGELTDNKGNKVSFRNAIILMTTNIGYDLHFAEGKGAGLFKVKGSNNDIMDAIEKYFAPEFLGRIDDVIVYNNLTDDVFDTLVKRYKNEFAENNDAIKNIKFTKKDLEEIKDRAKITQTGARSLKKAVKLQISDVMEREETKFKK